MFSFHCCKIAFLQIYNINYLRFHQLHVSYMIDFGRFCSTNQTRWCIAEGDEAGWVCEEQWEELRKLGQAGGWLVDPQQVLTYLCQLPVTYLYSDFTLK